ncbi:M28 family metallopeptidase [Salinirubellus sp. GCM10025818]|uniref:M28 family metallopeptidase n=1 Tax=Salinirubellus TaxID=2162630 RepID=UPI0030CC6628
METGSDTDTRTHADAATMGRAATDPFPARFIERLTDAGNRMGGHPGERRAAELVASALADVGADPREVTFPITRWTRGEAELVAPAGSGETGRSFETVGLPYTPAGDVRAPLVDAGQGTPAELDDVDPAGSIVLARQGSSGPRHVHRMEKYGHAVAAGAEAFVLVNDTPGGLPVTGTLRFGEPAAVPAVGVSHEAGERLGRYAADGASARLRVEADTDEANSRNVVAELGPDTDECVIVLAHMDAHDLGEGALDNGCGLTVAVEAARLLADRSLDRRVVVAGVSCEETGLLGSRALADSLDLDSVSAVVNVDGAGRARNLKAYTQGSEAIERLARETVEGVQQPLVVENRPHSYSDHWPFLRAGVPSLQLHSVPPDDDGSWGPRGLPVAHTRADTLDKVEIRNVREHAGLCALLVDAVARADPPRVDTTRLADRLREDDAEAGMRAAGIWPEGW